MPPGTPFGPNIHAVLAYLHHSHHVGFERLARLARELFGLTISEGAIANAMRRLETPLEAEREAIRAKLRAAQVVWSDETTTRIDGRIHWHWVFVTPEAVLHEIAPRRAKAVAEAVMGGHCQRRRESRPRGGAKSGQWRGAERHGPRARHIAGVGHGALARRANPATADQARLRLSGRGSARGGSCRRSSRGC
jgi:hypothetical protein